MRVLMLGDIYGRPGRKIVGEKLPEIKAEYRPDLIIANGENCASGFGLTRKLADELFDMGIDVITSGNHIWDQREMYTYIQEEPRILRPANYPPGVPGSYLYYAKVKDTQVAVISLTGRVFMGDFDCPFRRVDDILTEIGEKTPYIIIDFHGEATSEKVAFGYYVDGRVSAIVGTHTHIPTADHRILPKGTAYTTDLGMCGPMNGVLGVDPDTVIEKFLTQLPNRFTVAKGPVWLCGVLIDIDQSGRSQEISRISYQKNIV